jgi:O-antigen ligase
MTMTSGRSVGSSDPTIRTGLETRPHDRRVGGRGRLVHLVLIAGCVAVIAAGALTFGAVYPWAFQPLAVAMTVVGAACLLAGRTGRPPLILVATTLAVIAGAVAVQLVALPVPVLQRISPAADAFMRANDLSYQIAPQLHPLSIAPHDTLTGLMLFGALALFLLGAARLVSAVGARRIVRPIVIFGALLALEGIVQYGLTVNDYQPLIYGFWKPENLTRPFGPFVNPNHFAGWMLMALPLALAMFYDLLIATMRSAPGGRSGRIELVSSPQFGALVATAGINLVMALSLIMTRSRSALVAFAIGALIAAWTIARRQRTRTAKILVAASAAALLLGAAAWAGTDALVTKFTEPQGNKSFFARVSAWKDAVRIAHDFPLTGTGLDGFGTAMQQYQTMSVGHFAEAHNDYLQIAAEGGLLVGVPAIAALVVFVAAVRRRFREAPKDGSTYWLRVGAVLGLVSIGLQSLVEFSLQMPGNAALFALLAAVALHQSPNLTSRASK